MKQNLEEVLPHIQIVPEKWSCNSISIPRHGRFFSSSSSTLYCSQRSGALPERCGLTLRQDVVRPRDSNRSKMDENLPLPTACFSPVSGRCRFDAAARSPITMIFIFVLVSSFIERNINRAAALRRWSLCAAVDYCYKASSIAYGFETQFFTVRDESLPISVKWR